MTTSKSPYLVFCCNKFIINPDFVVCLQVTILIRSQTANDSDRYSSHSVLPTEVVLPWFWTSIIVRILYAVCVISTGFVLCSVPVLESSIMSGPEKIRSRGSWSHIVSKATDA